MADVPWIASSMPSYRNLPSGLAKRWLEGGAISTQWWDGTDVHNAELLGWYTGSTVEQVEVLGVVVWD